MSERIRNYNPTRREFITGLVGGGLVACCAGTLFGRELLERARKILPGEEAQPQPTPLAGKTAISEAHASAANTPGAEKPTVANTPNAAVKQQYTQETAAAQKSSTPVATETPTISVFSVNGQEIGGPTNQWWPLQDADGKFIPNSWKFVGMRTTDGSLPGYEMNVPEGMIAHAWIDHNSKKQTYEVMGGKGAKISGEFKVAEMSLYAKATDWDSSKAGKWVKIDNNFNEVSPWTNINTEPTDNANNSTTRMKVCQVFGANGNIVSTTSIPEGGVKYSGGVISINVASGQVANYWNGKETVRVKGPTTIQTGEGSFYCP